MRKLVPYKSPRYAVSALDNGGRFYNLYTKPDDGEITRAELAKVAGVYTNRQRMFLHLEMAIAELSDSDKSQVYGCLSKDLAAAKRKYAPAKMTPAEAADSGKPSRTAIVEGIPSYVKSAKDFSGFIPIMVGKVMVMIPIIDRYDVYEVREKKTSQKCLVAHARRKDKLPAIRTRFGGVLKKLNGKKGEPQKHKVFLDTIYYSPVEKNV